MIKINVEDFMARGTPLDPDLLDKMADSFLIKKELFISINEDQVNEIFLTEKNWQSDKCVVITFKSSVGWFWNIVLEASEDEIFDAYRRIYSLKVFS